MSYTVNGLDGADPLRGYVRSEVNIQRRRCWRCLLLAWRSCPNLFDERWIIIAAAALVDAPGHGPHAKAVLGGWSQKLGTGRADRPKLDILLIEDHRLAVVNRPGEPIGTRDDDRARRHSPQSVVFVIRAAPSPMRARLRRAQGPAGWQSLMGGLESKGAKAIDAERCQRKKSQEDWGDSRGPEAGG